MELSQTEPSKRDELHSFLHAIYGDAVGFSYVALLDRKADHHNFSQYFFAWPGDVAVETQFILDKKNEFEVYYSPALFRDKSAKKESVLGANVYWCEFDGVIPSDLHGFPEPTIRVNSSIPGHAHWYWRSDSFVGPFDLERVNRALTHMLGADASGYDANQILRPINTFNHKRQAAVTLADNTGKTVNASAFADLPAPPNPIATPLPENIPDVTDVIAKHQFSTLIFELFKKGVPEGKRSEGMMSLAYHLAEMQLTDGEVFSLLLNADMRWGKFKNRSDQLQRLSEIVAIARAKYPLKVSSLLNAGSDAKLGALGFNTFLSQEYNFEWVWDGWLQTHGYFLLTGPSGVGKTQFSLDAAAHFALGEDFLERGVPNPMKIGMLSLEMGGPDLQVFASKQAACYTKDQLELLEENFLVAAIGEPIYMDTEDGRKLIEEWIGDNHLQGVIVDSLGSSVAGELSAEGSVKQLMDWNDHIRQQFGCFTWFIHHHRKATGDNKKPNKLADVYGSHWITARATSVVCLWDLGIPGNLQAIPLKMRLSPDKDPFTLFRGSDLKFTKKLEGVTLVKPGVSSAEFVAEEEEENDHAPGEGFKGV